MSRPKKNAEARHSRQVIFRLTDAEYEALRVQAERAGMPPNELARRLARCGPGTIVIKTYRHQDPAFLKRLDQIGNNLNQLVKNAHIFGRVSPLLEQVCATIDRLIDEALAEDGDGS